MESTGSGRAGRRMRMRGLVAVAARASALLVLCLCAVNLAAEFDPCPYIPGEVVEIKLRPGETKKSRQCELHGQSTPLVFVDDLTQPQVTHESEKMRLCGGIDMRASSSDGHAWCNMAFESKAPGGPQRELIGMSFGVFTWDVWSKSMVNRKGVKEMRLFDCFAPIDKFNFDVYAHRPDYKPICLGPVTTIGNDARGDGVGRSFKTLWDVADWDAIPELGAAVKMDIEGGEWAVFDSAQRGGKFDTIMSKIALLDMEIHFCKTEFGYGNQTKMRKSIKMNLARLKRTFFIVGRWQDNLVTTGFDLAGCDKGHYNMMSLSYVNKGFFGKWRAGRTD